MNGPHDNIERSLNFSSWTVSVRAGLHLHCFWRVTWDKCPTSFLCLLCSGEKILSSETLTEMLGKYVPHRLHRNATIFSELKSNVSTNISSQVKEMHFGKSFLLCSLVNGLLDEICVLGSSSFTKINKPAVEQIKWKLCFKGIKESGMVIHTFYLWEFEASLVQIVKFQDSQGYSVGSRSPPLFFGALDQSSGLSVLNEWSTEYWTVTLP